MGFFDDIDEGGIRKEERKRLEDLDRRVREGALQQYAREQEEQRGRQAAIEFHRRMRELGAVSESCRAHVFTLPNTREFRNVSGYTIRTSGENSDGMPVSSEFLVTSSGDLYRVSRTGKKIDGLNNMERDLKYYPDRWIEIMRKAIEREMRYRERLEHNNR